MAYRSRLPRVKESISMDEAKRRALAYLARNSDRRSNPSSVAYGIWPGHEMRAQGAALAAGRVLNILQKEGLVQWSSTKIGRFDDWGWKITTAGEKLVK